MKAKKDQVNIRRSAWPESLWMDLEFEADGKSISLQETMKRRLLASFNAGAPAPVDPPSDDLRDRKLRAEVESRERINAAALGELSTRGDWIAALDEKISVARQAILNIANSVDGATDAQRAQLDKAVQDCLTTLSGGPA